MEEAYNCQWTGYRLPFGRTELPFVGSRYRFFDSFCPFKGCNCVMNEMYFECNKQRELVGVGKKPLRESV
jgi:hypothetical protein